MSELSTISTLNSKQDVDKQIAYIRNYLIQLKDEIESELNNVTYEMLSPNLKKRIDMINDDVVVAGEDKNNGALVLDSLLAQYASIGTLIATVGEIQTLTSMLATINTLNAEVANIVTLMATSATVGSIGCASLNASGSVTGNKGVFNSIEVEGDDATGISVKSVKSQILEPNQGESLTINGGADHRAGSITMGEGRFGTLKIHIGGTDYMTVGTKKITYEGEEITVLKI